MAREPRSIEVEYTAQALADLDDIWDWNARRRGSQDADKYIAFLKAGTRKLTQSANPGTVLLGRELYRYAIIRRRHRGYGHLVVFSLDGLTLRVHRYYHTSQDWQSMIADEPGF